MVRKWLFRKLFQSYIWGIPTKVWIFGKYRYKGWFYFNKRKVYCRNLNFVVINYIISFISFSLKGYYLEFGLLSLEIEFPWRQFSILFLIENVVLKNFTLLKWIYIEFTLCYTRGLLDCNFVMCNTRLETQIELRRKIP